MDPADPFDLLPCGLRDWSEPHPLLSFPRCRLDRAAGAWASPWQCRSCRRRDPGGWWGPEDRPPRGDRLVVRAALDSHSGYGQLADEFGRILERRGIPVAFVPTRLVEAFLPLTDSVRSRLVREAADPWEFLIGPPQTRLDAQKATILYTMWETTRLPAGCVPRLNQAEAVIVPSRWCADVFSANGVDAPLFVVPPGIDRGAYRPTDPPGGPVCRFGTAGRLAHGGPRKGIEAVIEAFRLAFPDEPNARLSVKVWPDCPIPPEADPRIELIRTPMTTAELGDWYRSLHVYVSASKGEGFGLQPLQAMACGRPVIAAPFAGHGEYFDDSVGYPLRFEYRRADGHYRGCGHWAIPDRGHLVARFREAHADRERAAALGRAAARRAERFTWDRTGRALDRVLRDVGAIRPRPSRRPPRLRIAFYYDAPYTFDEASYATGVGGTEAAFLHVVAGLEHRGHAVEVFAKPPADTLGKFRRIEEFDPEAAPDVLVVMRSGAALLRSSRARVKIFWTTHERLDAGEVARADAIVCSSPFHRRYLVEGCGIDAGKVRAIPHGIDAAEYAEGPPKTPGKLIYCSVPDRGAAHLPAVFAAIRERVPWATLHLTSDFSLWGKAAGDEAYRRLLEGRDGVSYHGRVPRDELVRHQLTAELMLYPCGFDEFFCIAALECQAAGAVPVVKAAGALPETIDGHGVVVPDGPDWRERLATAAADLLLDPEARAKLAASGRRRALGTFDWSFVIRNEWEPLCRSLLARTPRPAAAASEVAG